MIYFLIYYDQRRTHSWFKSLPNITTIAKHWVLTRVTKNNKAIQSNDSIIGLSFHAMFGPRSTSYYINWIISLTIFVPGGPRPHDQQVRPTTSQLNTVHREYLHINYRPEHSDLYLCIRVSRVSVISLPPCTHIWWGACCKLSCRLISLITPLYNNRLVMLDAVRGCQVGGKAAAPLYDEQQPHAHGSSFDARATAISASSSTSTSSKFYAFIAERERTRLAVLYFLEFLFFRQGSWRACSPWKIIVWFLACYTERLRQPTLHKRSRRK